MIFFLNLGDQRVLRVPVGMTPRTREALHRPADTDHDLAWLLTLTEVELVVFHKTGRSAFA